SPVPTAYLAVASTTLNVDGRHRGMMLVTQSASANAVVNILSQAESVSAGYPWQAGDFLWVRAASATGGWKGSVTGSVGVNILNGYTAGAVDLAKGAVILFWRTASDSWWAVSSLSPILPTATATAVYTGVAQTLTTAYADVAGGSISYSPKYNPSRIVVEMSLLATTTAGDGIFHSKFLAGGTEQTSWRTTDCAGAGAGRRVQLKGSYDSTSVAAITFKFQARNHSAGSAVKLHETTEWDGAAGAHRSGAVLRVSEDKM
ncbi:MAG TPA: hypothetical protein PLA50_04525, partial [Bacteroidia bacterium]|nr:hypothetical protein [Bacteroidia bacterium]